MPRLVRDLIADLQKAGFALVKSQGNGSHRTFRHASGVTAIISGKAGADAKHYQERQLIQKINETKK